MEFEYYICANEYLQHFVDLSNPESGGFIAAGNFISCLHMQFIAWGRPNLRGGFEPKMLHRDLLP
jgi:hypothetical protein